MIITYLHVNNTELNLKTQAYKNKIEIKIPR